MTETIDGSAASPSPTLPVAMRFGRWALFILAVAAAAVAVRQASDVDRAAETPSAMSAEAPIELPSAPVAAEVAGGLPPGLPDQAPPDGAAAAAITAAPLSVASTGAGSLDRSYSIASGGEFTVDVAVGDIKVTRAPGSQARVVIELEPGAAPEKVRIVEQEVTPGAVHLSFEPADKDGGSLSFFGGHVRFGSGLPMNLKIRQVRVEVPAGVRVALSTGAGDVAASDIAGDVRAETGSGDIAVQRAAGVEASTGAGDVSLRDVAGAVHVTSSKCDLNFSK